MSIQELQQNEMMSHLLSALGEGEDIGHFGRLVFAMIARYFLDETELTKWLCKDPTMDDVKAKALIEQVAAHDYSPPQRDRILEWQRHQKFPICPSDDPDACNVYRNLKFPKNVYEHIQHYHEQKAEAKT